ncbi:nickel-dependent hydrogenase large subunit [Pseudonocardia kunmingensis]|uniref:Hydrogenase large subunit n=1 Tax=Pseudonocardia kunmingensis TaxID=630975 RepID=A0A543DP48_9PSEU|nr:nickel-dependent hydrogenase large subunit [Pseudonocardia kunmingensis]TQM11101.1 hydrogenase large subunit [Pseudonocardia kunmingensis]
MCFKNLPIEFDATGRATLRGGIRDPYSLDVSKPDVAMNDAQREEQIRQLVAANGHIKDINMDPVTRVAGALALHITADMAGKGRYLDARSQATLFRGYEVILMGRDPRDAIFVSSRACGVCGGVHAHAAAYAIEMAMGLKPPPMGTVVRNMQEAAEMGYDNPLHLYLLAGPDYSEPVIKAVNPELWTKAETWKCPSERQHGFKTMAELMTALTPLTGQLYREGLEFTRLSREMFVTLAGKYPHPQTVVPGGVSSTLTLQTLNEYHSRLGKIFDYAQRMLGVWNDIPEFFYEADERYMQVGARPTNLIDPGYWDDPFAYDATYENCNSWGEKRWSTPGVVIDGQLVTTRLTDLNIGLEEFVEHSYYEQWAGDRYATDPIGNPISPYHPWNKQTLPKPGEKSWKDKYSWATAPRWDRKVVEAGAYARMYMTAMAQKLPTNDFIEATGHSLRMGIPKGITQETEVEWHVPPVLNAFERNRGRAHHYVFSQLVGLANLLEAYRLFKTGETQVAAVPPDKLDDYMGKDERVSVGWWGAGRGWLTHHMVMDQAKIVNYQILTPSTFNASPRDPWDQPGPYEEAVMNTPIIEDVSDPSKFTSIDMLRAIRSFDPCMPCTTHTSTGEGTVVREVNTCSCGAD